MDQDYEKQVTKSILEVAEQEIERNPTQLLTLDRGKAAALIDGALDRSGVYQKAEAVIAGLIDAGAIEVHIRELRRAEVGDDLAEEERQKGAKTDEEYGAETAARRAERERVREELRQVEEESRRLKREIREKEEQKRREEERPARKLAGRKRRRKRSSVKRSDENDASSGRENGTSAVTAEMSLSE